MPTEIILPVNREYFQALVWRIKNRPNYQLTVRDVDILERVAKAGLA